MIVPLAGDMFDFSVGMPAEVFVFVEIVAMIASEVIVPVSHGRDGRAGVMIDALMGTVISVVPFSGTKVLAAADTIMLPATRTALASMPMLTSSEDALAFGSGASSCWPATA